MDYVGPDTNILYVCMLGYNFVCVCLCLFSVGGDFLYKMGVL